jgi:hypothetical protein
VRTRVHAIALVLLVALPGALLLQRSLAADTGDPPATPQAKCGPGSLPETGRQGRVPPEDVESGRAAEGYWCNAKQIGHFGPWDTSAGSGGYKVHRYVDRAGRECAYYDSTLLFPLNVPQQGANLSGVHVLDMTDPADPVKTANLLTPAMESPHESLSFSSKRGLIAAGMGTPVTAPGQVDIYDASNDCRQPELRSSLPVGILGHEGNFSPDGNTLYISATGAENVTAIDVSDPVVPRILWRGPYRFHGMTISDDGKRMYAADLGNSGLTILDVSDIHSREPDPVVTVVSHLTWDVVTIPQQPMPFTVKGRPYLVEVDEFTRDTSTDPSAPVGAARIIDIADERKPRVVSDLRLEVNQREHRPSQADDRGASNALSGYTAHYCATPKRKDPGIVACSFVLSGLRVFDIRNPLKPREVAYFNPGGETASYAMSAPAFVEKRSQIWYSDGNKGFFVVRITNGAWKR